MVSPPGSFTLTSHLRCRGMSRSIPQLPHPPISARRRRASCAPLQIALELRGGIGFSG